MLLSGWPQTSKKLPSVNVRGTGDSMWMIPSAACVCSHEKHEPATTNGPSGVAWASGDAIPIPGGTVRGLPSTKTVRCAWMWNSTCSLGWQRILSTGPMAAASPVGASWAPAGIGTPSGPG